jgi:hypothetical protein
MVPMPERIKAVARKSCGFHPRAADRETPVNRTKASETRLLDMRLHMVFHVHLI